MNIASPLRFNREGKKKKEEAILDSCSNETALPSGSNDEPSSLPPQGGEKRARRRGHGEGRVKRHCSPRSHEESEEAWEGDSERTRKIQGGGN